MIKTTNILIATFLILFAALIVETTFEWRANTSLGGFLTNMMSSKLAMAQNGDSCSDYVGNATINEVRRSGNKDNFIELRILDNDISNSTIKNWTIHFASNKGSNTVHLDNEFIHWSGYPWIIIPEELIENHKYIDLHKGMEILFEDEFGKPIDYLNVANYSNHLSPKCNDFYFDTKMEGTNSHTILRDPDGTGNWTDAGSGNSGPPTRGGRNIGDIKPGDFNVVEAGKDRWAETLYTKISGKNFSVDVIRETLFTFLVELELVDAGTGENCASLNHIADLGYAEFYPFEFRTTVTELSYDNAIASARIRVTDVYDEDVQGCSLDTFTVRPAYLTLNATDRDWEGPGTNRTLNGSNLDTCQEAGGTETCHIASHSFTLQGNARDDANGTAAGYSATADLDIELHAPSKGALGSYSPKSVYFNESEFRTDNTTYDEVGLINGTLNDIGRFATLSGDKQSDHCVEGSSSNTQNNDDLYGCQTETQEPRQIGRFVPDHFQVASNAPFFEPFCDGFTYLEQPFYYSVAPSITLTARNADDGITENYGSDFWKFDNPAGYLGNRVYNGTDTAEAFLNATLHENAYVSGEDDFDGNGTFALPGYYNSTTNGDEFKYVKNGTEAPFNATVDLTLDRTNFTDQDGVCYEVNGSCSGYSIEDITGTELRYGRLILKNAYGSELLNLEVPIKVQHYDGSVFTHNNDDHCTQLAMGNSTDSVEMEMKNKDVDWQPANQTIQLAGDKASGSTVGFELTNENATGSNLSLNKGTASLVLEAPGTNNTGYVHVRCNLQDHPWLRYDWSGNGNHTDYPNATATFGIYKGNEHIIYQQETTWK